MDIPKFIIKTDKEQDLQQFLYFFEQKNPTIQEFFPNVSIKDDIKKIIDDTYSENKLQSTVDWMKSESLINEIAKRVAELTKTDWRGIQEVTIYPSVCPVCPRFLETNSFMINYELNNEAIFSIVAHELTHFLYFKTLKLEYPNINTEYPSQDWLISEVFIPCILNQPEIMNITHIKEYVYLSGKNMDKKLIKQIQSCWKGNIIEFRDNALKKMSDRD